MLAETCARQAPPEMAGYRWYGTPDGFAAATLRGSRDCDLSELCGECASGRTSFCELGSEGDLLDYVTIRPLRFGRFRARRLDDQGAPILSEARGVRAALHGLRIRA